MGSAQRWLGASVLLCAATASRAQPRDAPPSSQPTIQLAYAAPGECPDALAVRAGVIAQLGYDPVTADAPRTIAIAITRVAAGYQAVVTLATPGQPPSTRTLPPSARCEGVMPPLELAVAVAVEAGPPPQPPPPQPVAPPTTPAPAVPAPAPLAPRPWWTPVAPAPSGPPRSELVLHGGTHLGALREVSGGGGVSVGYRVRRWRLEARVWTARTRGQVANATIDNSLVEVSFDGCRVLGLVDACVGAGVGSKQIMIVQSNGDFTTTDLRDDSTAYALVTARVAVTLPLSDVWLVRPGLRLGLPLPAVDITSPGRVWAEATPIDLAVDLGVGWRW
ncbi:MAG: hypothetical protein IPH44_28440 [Myxococcales bacterium]|nr:hypothetical protein [Myxococcales bacterium]MBK7191463.1 hypothetical protein [Myxococcales bacterium]MBP6846693.1 hypothetical protein [Kofleriaceae bacterium]